MGVSHTRRKSIRLYSISQLVQRGHKQRKCLKLVYENCFQGDFSVGWNLMNKNEHELNRWIGMDFHHKNINLISSEPKFSQCPFYLFLLWRKCSFSHRRSTISYLITGIHIRLDIFSFLIFRYSSFLYTCSCVFVFLANLFSLY